MVPMSAKKHKVDGGWLQMQRERHDLGPEYMPPPPKRMHMLAEVMPGVMKGMGLESPMRVSDLEPKWADLVGATNANHSRPGKWEKGVLTIYVDHNVWLAELKRNASVAILKRLKTLYGKDAPKSLRFQIDPGEDDWR